MATLFAAQVCASTGFSMGMAVGAIMAAAITGTNTWSGLPVAVGSLGTALAAWPLSRVMVLCGRRPGLTAGYGIAVAGAVLGIIGVIQQSFSLFLAGMVLFGTAQTSNLLARYAAADITPGAQRGRAMGLIVWGSAAGSILGPMLMNPAIRVGATLGLSSVASAFLISATGYGVAALLVQALLRPYPLAIARRLEPPTQHGADARSRATGAILREPRVLVAYGTLMVSQLVMIGTTSTSPLYLHDHGHAVGTIGVAVSLHLGDVYHLAALGLAVRSLRTPADDRRGRRRTAGSARPRRLAAGTCERCRHRGTVSERRRLEPRVRLRERAADRRAVAARARLDSGLRRPRHGPDGRRRQRAGRRRARRVGLRHAQ